jgi:hypothetical protein
MFHSFTKTGRDVCRPPEFMGSSEYGISSGDAVLVTKSEHFAEINNEKRELYI